MREDAEYLRAQAGLRDKAEKRDGAAQSLLDRFGTAPENEEKALAEIAQQHGDDPALKRLYVGRLQGLRQQEQREVAQSVGTVYQLVLEGRRGEIAAADLQRLHKAGQMEGLFEAAQYGRSAEHKGDLLFKERYLAMGEAERGRFGVAELAKRMSPQDFLEVVQGAAKGGEDQTQRARMESFIHLVRPILRSVTLGRHATPQELERDRKLLGLIHEEVQMLVGDEEKKKNGRMLTVPEYQSVTRRAANRALLRHASLEDERYQSQWRDIALEVE